MKVTYQIAMAAGLDAGNKLMRERGLTEWDEACWNRASDVFSYLMAHAA